MFADVNEPSGGLRGFGEGDRRWRVEVELRDASLGDDGITVEQDGSVAVPLVPEAVVREEVGGEASPQPCRRQEMPRGVPEAYPPFADVNGPRKRRGKVTSTR